MDAVFEYEVAAQATVVLKLSLDVFGIIVLPQPPGERHVFGIRLR